MNEPNNLRARPLIAFITLILLCSIAAISSFGQQAATATIEGFVTDQNGAVVPGAKVAIRSTQTGLMREIVTDESGIYRFPALPPGNYAITASAAGFAENKYSNLTLTVGQKLNIDLMLRVNVSETVNITAAAPTLETTRTNVSSSINSKSVSELPVNGRNFLDFVTLTPGVVRDPRQGDLSFGGQRGTFNNLQIDGVDNNNNFFGQALGRTGSGRAPYQFSQDAVQEFQVNTSTFSAEFGQAAGGVINVVTKSGTNEYHGTGFEFFRDASLNARRPNFIPARNGLVPVKESYHFHQFGGNIGGPIKTDRAFFFFNYDGQRNTRPVIMALGIGAPADAAAQRGLQLLLPFVQNYTLGFNQDVYLGKVDWQIDSVNRINFRYNRQNFKGRNLENSGATSAQEHSGNSNVTTDTYTVTLNSAFTPRFLNEFRAQIAFDKEPGTSNTDNAEGNILQAGTTALVIGRNSFSPRDTSEDKYQFVDNVSYFTGKHSIKGGATFIIEKIKNFFPGNFGGRYFFQSTNPGGFAEFGNHFDPTSAGFRFASRYQQSFAGDGTSGPLTNPDFNEYGLFIQDDWRIANRLTLNFGVRYDVQLMRKPTTANPSAALAAAGISTTQFHNDFDNVAPRFGFAWSPTEKLVVRGGYGLFFGRTPSIALATAHSNNGINVIGITLTNVRLPFTYPNRFADLGSILALGGQAGVPDIFIFDKNYQQPYTQQGSFGVEYGLTNDLSVGASYLMVKGTNLSRTRDLNLPTPVLTSIPIQGGGTVSYLRHPGGSAPARPVAGFGRISQFEGSADSNYNALALTLNKRFSRNFQALASYTWSKVIDNTPDQTSVVVGGGDDAKQAQQSFLLSDDRGLGVADVPHRFVLSGVWELNYFNSLNSGIKFFLGGWQVGGILQVASNQPFTQLLGADLNNDINNRTDRTPTVGRNTIRVGRTETVDFRLTKTFNIYEDKVRIQLIGELFNAFNHTNVVSFQSNLYRVTGLNTPAATLVPRTDYLDPRGVPADGQRIGQIAAKIIF